MYPIYFLFFYFHIISSHKIELLTDRSTMTRMKMLLNFVSVIFILLIASIKALISEEKMNKVVYLALKEEIPTEIIQSSNSEYK